MEVWIRVFLEAAVGRESKQVSVYVEAKRGKKKILKQLVIPVLPSHFKTNTSLWRKQLIGIPTVKMRCFNSGLLEMKIQSRTVSQWMISYIAHCSFGLSKGAFADLVVNSSLKTILLVVSHSLLSAIKTLLFMCFTQCVEKPQRMNAVCWEPWTWCNCLALRGWGESCSCSVRCGTSWCCSRKESERHWDVPPVWSLWLGWVAGGCCQGVTRAAEWHWQLSDAGAVCAPRCSSGQVWRRQRGDHVLVVMVTWQAEGNDSLK